MEPPFTYSFKDILWAPARALSAKQILSQTLFLLLGYFLYLLGTYIAFLADGQSLDVIFGAYGFFPIYVLTFQSLSAKIIWVIAIILALFSVMVGFFCVSAINIESIRGNRFFTAKQSIKFAKKRIRQLFLAELSIFLFVGFVILLFVLLGFLTRIPFIGEWIYLILFVIPNFIVALLSVFIIFVLSLSFLVLPAVAAAEREGETFTVILETFSTIMRQPVRWVGYTLYSIVAGKLASFVFAYFCFRAVQFMAFTSSIGGGQAIPDLIRKGLSQLPLSADFMREMFSLFPGINIVIPIRQVTMVHDLSFSADIMSFMLFLIYMIVVGYLLAVIASAQARSYAAIRFMKDNYRIDEETPLFFTDENINPPMSEADRERFNLSEN